MKLHPFARIGLVVLMLVGAFIAGQQYSRPVAAQGRSEVGIPDCRFWLRRLGSSR
jgi:hypothetical protein